MSIRVTELTFLEQFASRYGIPVPRHIEGSAKRSELKKVLSEWGGKALVKPDVLTGRRGKAGTIIQVDNVPDAIRQAKRIAGTEINGNMPRTSYLVEVIPAAFEMYSAITYNSSFLQPSFTLSLKGGMDIEEVSDKDKITIPVDIFRGLDAYQAGELLAKLGCEKHYISILSRTLVSFWDLFVSTGMQTAEINPWRITPEGKPFACDFKAIIDESNYKSKIPGVEFPDYPENISSFEEEMAAWSASSHQGQAHVSDLGGSKILPILFGGGASTIITETLEVAGGDPMFLSDFGGNPPYERMLGTAKICFDHKLKDAQLLLILGGKANNTFIDVTFQAIGDALINYVEERGPLNIPVVVGRGGPRLVKGLLSLKQTLEYLKLPYVIFGPDTPVTLVAEYAAKLADAVSKKSEVVS
ncbi:MAG TPA: ATP citrate lyase citrate-binding domain-containing protein [Deltaproteobacteria bacterium]|nr:ATP citrate lyase citrate-binding domain-containing protein [Deltaproteobacteria bacterium]